MRCAGCSIRDMWATAAPVSTSLSTLPSLSLALLALAALLLLWAPMALVMYLRTGATVGLVWLPGGLQLIARDPIGYALLLVLVGSSLIVQIGANLALAALPFFVEFPVHVVKGIAVLGGWGLCGLYIRGHARTLDFPCDDDDWVAHPWAAPPPDPTDVLPPDPFAGPQNHALGHRAAEVERALDLALDRPRGPRDDGNR